MMCRAQLSIIIKQQKMSNNEERQIINVLFGQEPNSRIFTEKFELLNSSVTHENRLQVQQTAERYQNLQIRNYFATANGNQVAKITQIQLEDKIIKITDTFTSVYHAPMAICSNSSVSQVETAKTGPVRRNILDKRAKGLVRNSNGQEEFRLRDTKNVVKNIFRLFHSWVEQNCPIEFQLSTALNQLLLKHGKYNNNLVINISKHPQLRQAFLAFSNTQGEQCIERSKINDKKSHHQALKKYRRICLESQIKEESFQHQDQEEEMKQIKIQDERMEDQSEDNMREISPEKREKC